MRSSLNADTIVLPILLRNARCGSLPSDALPCAHATSQLRLLLRLNVVCRVVKLMRKTTLHRETRLALHRWSGVKSARSERE